MSASTAIIVFLALILLGMVAFLSKRRGYNIPWINLLVIIGFCFLFYRGCISSDGKHENSRSRTTTYHAPPPTIKTGPVPTFHPFGPDGCYNADLGYQARWSPNKGSMRVYDPSGGSHLETLGKKSPISAFGPGRWVFCADGPDPATGVVLWE